MIELPLTSNNSSRRVSPKTIRRPTLTIQSYSFGASEGRRKSSVTIRPSGSSPIEAHRECLLHSAPLRLREDRVDQDLFTVNVPEILFPTVVQSTKIPVIDVSDVLSSHGLKPLL